MKLNTMLTPIGALVIALGVSGFTAEAAQRDRNGRDRNGRESQGQVRERDGARADEGRQAESPRADAGRGVDRGRQQEQGRVQRPQVEANRGGREYDNRAGRDNGSRGRYENREQRREVVPYRRDNDRREFDRGRSDRRDAYRYEPYRNDGYPGYGSPRVVPGRPGHYYGSGGNFSAYFGWGNGYRYGSPWSGRVYGYLEPRGYGSRIYYGDVRLQVRPRDAEVFVDGYYAGIVDDFDGVFQRLTLQVGPHQIEIDASGLEPQFFDVYVDPARTVDIRSDLFR